MRDALVVDSNDIKEILAEKFNVPEKNVIQSKYSYTIILDKEEVSEHEHA